MCFCRPLTALVDVAENASAPDQQYREVQHEIAGNDVCGNAPIFTSGSHGALICRSRWSRGAYQNDKFQIQFIGFPIKVTGCRFIVLVQRVKELNLILYRRTNPNDEPLLAKGLLSPQDQCRPESRLRSLG